MSNTVKNMQGIDYSKGKQEVELTKSMKESAYFSHDSGYDPLVYENTPENWIKIVGMLMLFYLFQGFHWWANFELGTNEAYTSTAYNLLVFLLAVVVITIMVILGEAVNKKKIEHEFYTECISAEKQRQAEDQAKETAKAMNEAKIKKTGM